VVTLGHQEKRNQYHVQDVKVDLIGGKNMSYSGVTQIKGKKHIWLQSAGYAPAKKIENFKKGDKMAFNYGIAYTVVSKPKKTSAKFYTVKIRSPEGKIYNKKVKQGSYKPYYK